MRRDAIIPPSHSVASSFLSCEKDFETILKKLFVTSKPYSDVLKKLLIINMSDCLDENSEHKEVYEKIIKEKSLKDLIEEGYIKMEPKIQMPEHEEVKSYIIISFDNFTPNASNPYFRDCSVTFDIICHTDYWSMNDYQLRPLKIAGYIDGLLNNQRLSGIGIFNFLGCNQIVLDEYLSGYTLMYRAVHGNDDKLPPKDE